MNDYEKLLYKTNRQKRQLRILMAKNKLLKQKVNQLETNIEKAIELIEGTWIGYCKEDCEWFEELQHKLLSILRSR